MLKSKGSEVILRILENKRLRKKIKQKRKLRNCPIKAAGGKKAEKEETGQGGAV